MAFSLLTLKWVFVFFCAIEILPAAAAITYELEAALKCSKENNRFGTDLYEVLRKNNPDENLLVSPLSLRTIMAMVQAGAEENTAKEILLGMRFPENNGELFNSYAAMRNISDYLRRSDGKPSTTFPVTIEEANRVFIKGGYPVKHSFQQILKHHFQAPLAQINFSNGKKAAEEINNWVSDQTQQKITRLIEADALNNQTKLVLVNTLYFKGPWENRFHGRATQKQIFHGLYGQKTMVDMMNIDANFVAENVEELNAKAVVLPYEGNRFRFVILLPNEPFDIKDVETKLKDYSLSEMFERLSNSKLKYIDLSIPRFSIESSFDLMDVMKTLNIKDLFNEKKANLKGIVNDDVEGEKLYVNNLVQKTFLSVAETGSEAGSATFAAIFSPLSIGPTLEDTIVVDRPFNGFIYDSKLNLNLFSFRKTSF